MPMPAADPATQAASGYVVRALLWLEIVALAAATLQFTFAPSTVQRPLLAVATLALLTVNIPLVRIIPFLQSPRKRGHGFSIVVLITSITSLAAATGAAESALVALYSVPLAAAALAFGRWWLVLALAVIIGLLGCILGKLTPDVDINSGEFGVLLLAMLAPAVAVSLVMSGLIAKMHTAVKRINALAASDQLTGLLNLHTFEDVLQQEHRKAERFGRPYALVVVDIDNLTQINETLGHDAGSEVIVSVAAAIKRSIRASDIAARLGGDEFVVLLMEADSSTGAVIAQRIRNNVYAGTVSVANRMIRANACLGAASFPEDHLFPKELMILADQRMRKDRELRRPPGEGKVMR